MPALELSAAVCRKDLNRTAQQEEYNWKMGLNGFPVELPPKHIHDEDVDRETAAR